MSDDENKIGHRREGKHNTVNKLLVEYIRWKLLNWFVVMTGFDRGRITRKLLEMGTPRKRRRGRQRRNS